MVKKEIKSAFSFVKQTVKFVFFLAHLLFQTKGNLKNPLKKVYSGKVAMLANGPSMKNVLPRLTTDEFKNTDFIVLNFFGSMDIFTQIRPKHFCMADPMFFQENHNHDRVMKLFDDLNKKVDWEMNLYIPASLKRQFLAFSGLHNSHIHIVPLNLTVYTGYEEFRHYSIGMVCQCLV